MEKNRRFEVSGVLKTKHTTLFLIFAISYFIHTLTKILNSKILNKISIFQPFYIKFIVKIKYRNPYRLNLYFTYIF